MSDWDFLWGLSGQALEDAMSSGATYEEWGLIEQELGRELIGSNGKNVMVFVDGENVPAKYYDQIKSQVKWLVDQHQAKAYARQKDGATQRWHDVSRESGIKEIRLCGGPAKNKVDKKIIKDMKSFVGKCVPSETTLFLVTSDTDFATTVKELREMGVKVIGFGEAKSSMRLRDAYDEFFELHPEQVSENDEDEDWYEDQPLPSWYVGGSDAYRYG